MCELNEDNVAIQNAIRQTLGGDMGKKDILVCHPLWFIYMCKVAEAKGEFWSIRENFLDFVENSAQTSWVNVDKQIVEKVPFHTLFREIESYCKKKRFFFRDAYQKLNFEKEKGLFCFQKFFREQIDIRCEPIKHFFPESRATSFVRFGAQEGNVALPHLLNQFVCAREQKIVKVGGKISEWSGVYGTQQDMLNFQSAYCDAVKQSDYLHCINEFPFLYELAFICMFPTIQPVTRLPFGMFDWFQKLKGKRILVISPFVETFRRQIESKNCPRCFDKHELSIEADFEIKFVWQKAPFSAAGHTPHSGWSESFDILCRECEEGGDFDIALVSCGGYGLPVCNFIKQKLGKHAIYGGGHLQLFFGVTGNRWKKAEKNFVLPGTERFWVRPGEKFENSDKIEGGCYW